MKQIFIIFIIKMTVKKMNSLNCYGYKENDRGLVSLKTQFQDEQGAVDKAQDKKIDELAELINEESGETVEKMIEVTYAELVNLRDTSSLSPGQLYRITDYTTTTVQADTQSAGHQFDVIVLATDTNKLSEEALAAFHEGDTYFTAAGAKLDAWKLMYCLDNDTNRFAWADTTNGKGVIYRMIDEKNNDCPYDFKNIMFKVGANQIAGTKADVFYYTFSVATGTNDANVTDHSLNANCYSNVMGTTRHIINNKLSLNVNVFRNTSLNDSCFSNTFGSYCYNNTFGSACYNNTFGAYFSNNTFSTYCSNNTFSNSCSNNTFGSGCYSNTFGTYFSDNTFGTYCSNNTFGGGCNYNKFGTYCSNNKFGSECRSNTFGNNCSSNTFGSYCYNNTFGSACSSNTFGSGCYSNKFGTYCYYNTFDNGCYENIFGTVTNQGSEVVISPDSYFFNIIFDNGCIKNKLHCTSTTSYSQKFQNIHVLQGVSNKSISIDTVNNNYAIIVKSSGTNEITV